MISEYLFTFHRGEPEPAFVQSMSFDTDSEAIREAGELLRAQAEMVRHPVTSICVARGSGDDAEWLGAWEASDDGVRWEPEE